MRLTGDTCHYSQITNTCWTGRKTKCQWKWAISTVIIPSVNTCKLTARGEIPPNVQKTTTCLSLHGSSLVPGSPDGAKAWEVSGMTILQFRQQTWNQICDRCCFRFQQRKPNMAYVTKLRVIVSHECYKAFALFMWKWSKTLLLYFVFFYNTLNL